MAVMVVGIGCGSPVTEVVTPIGAFPELHLEMTANGLTAILGDEHMLDQPDPCPVVQPDLVAHFDGVEVPIVERGAFIEYGFDEYELHCAPPRLHVETAPPYGLARLELHDASGTVTCVLPDLAATRALALVPPGPWAFRQGKLVTVQWSPASDLAVLAPQIRVRDSRGNRTSAEGLTIDDDRLTFRTPTVAPGPYDLEISLHGLRCGASPMLVELSSMLTKLEASQPITIAL